jgi:nucleoside-triphosphatase
MNRIVLITGERGVGKTFLCQKVVEEAQRAGHSCAGLLSPPRSEVQQKEGIGLLDVRSGEERPLATADDASHGLRWGRYRFATSTLEWGSRVLAEATPCDLLVVDELGPLELETGQGLVKALDVLVQGDYALALVVVRPELIGALQERLPGHEIDVIRVTLSNRDRLSTQIAGRLEEVAGELDLRVSTE